MSDRPCFVSRVAVPVVCLLIAFLAYTSQYLFLRFKALPLRVDEVWRLNVFALCIWICYYRACTVDPGHVPKGWKPPDHENIEPDQKTGRQRWCRKCEAFKPPRAHHCKTCRRCIPKMDHHCPWTSNCVSYFTFPHFIRFLFYAVVGMSYLESYLFARIWIIWDDRNLPSYLGPSGIQIGHLFILIVVNSLTLFSLAILLARNLWALATNTTTIESWEIERHRTLVRRARFFGGCLDGPNGVSVYIKKQEFPYDIGIWKNIRAGMGGSINIMSWFWPFARTPSPCTGLQFEVNGFEDPNLPWPPPDPDRIPLPRNSYRVADAFTVPVYKSSFEEIEAFNRRKAEDLKRFDVNRGVRRRKQFHARFHQQSSLEDETSGGGSTSGDSDEGEEAWKNSEGERLRDFGVDEDIEFYDEEDIPLRVLMQRNNQRREEEEVTPLTRK